MYIFPQRSGEKEGGKERRGDVPEVTRYPGSPRSFRTVFTTRGSLVPVPGGLYASVLFVL